MNVRELIEKLSKLRQDAEIIVSARLPHISELDMFEHYHKGPITSITYDYCEYANLGKYVIESNDASATFTEDVRIGANS
jgi:hypothetical protein